jgi:hypothetical protein
MGSDAVQLQCPIAIQYFQAPVEPVAALVPEPSPTKFQKGDWLTSLPYVSPSRTVQVASTTMCAWGGGWKFQPMDSTEWYVFSAFRKATPEEVRAVTHFTPKVGMILRHTVNGVVYAITDEKLNAIRLSDSCGFANLSDGCTPIKEQRLAHAYWNILDSYEVKGVK